MYLKEIKAHGFKSFADKTSIELTPLITGIVGPNGSGKSNVVDAVRWVLGEQKIKSLRGDNSMTDVIFSGSKSRNSSNTASVTLIFDNKDHFINLDYDEVSIKRRVYNDGTNEYFINNEKCRLKDITDLLIDNGITKETFNIISQGKIDEILISKPTERRIIFEEAAGVLKYKKRKEEALRKLDRTHDNMTRINDIINELEGQVVPLKEQSEKATKYNEIKEELESVEIALITNDITNMNYTYKDKKGKIDEINNKITSLSTSNTKYDAKIENVKFKIQKLDKDINIKQIELVNVTSSVEKLNSRKAIILERQKYSVDDTKLHNNLVSLKENKLRTENNIKLFEEEITNFNNQNKNLDIKKQDIEKDITVVKNNKDSIDTNLSLLNRTNINLKNRIDNLRNSIDESGNLPYAVKCVLNNPKLRGIYDVLGNVIEMDSAYMVAISTSLGLSLTNVIVDDDNSAKEAVNYLKQNSLGRVTFFPLSIIKPRAIEEDIIIALKKMVGFVGIASDLVKYNQVYYNIISNQLGNVIVCDNIDNANKIAKKINYRYKIVTLDGELLHIGGAITGGTNKTRNIINDKYDLEIALLDLTRNENEIKDIENKVNENDSLLKVLEDKLYLLNKECITNQEYINNKNNAINLLKSDLESIDLEITGTNNILDNNLSKEEEEVINNYYSEVSKKELIETEIDGLNNDKNGLNDELDEFLHLQRKENGLFNDLNNELKNLEIDVNRMDVKLDGMLNILSETYNITYEKANSLYILELDPKIARTKVNALRKELKEIGIVNLGAISEYERVSKRYEFLIKQKEDLYKAENTLLEVINEMDEVMKKDFINTFNIVNDNFKQTFKELFNGGNACLKLTDTADLLETGIDIIASPPGKKLTTISLLSGGEKTLTAISLLFAILKSKKVPFCIFDEVEAALDDVNVDSFGRYINGLKDKTQFILITHKKKTMEFVDTLYGITMQESGVSKLVSVTLKDIK